MKANKVLLSAIVSVAFLVTRGFAKQVHCPENISVKQSLAQPLQGWKESASDMPNRLAGVTFFDGPPEQKASLVYDDEHVIKRKQIATWRFTRQSKIWVSCGYSGSNIELSKALTEGTTSCSVTYNPGITVTGLPSIEEIDCK